MPATSQIAASALVRSWPTGFMDALPSEDWLVLHANPRQEKTLARDLTRLERPWILFLEKRVRRYKNKGPQVSEVPLLGGYIFCHAPIEAKYDIFRTDRVVNIITVREGRRLASDLASLRALVERSQAPMVIRPELVPGASVVIRAGTFAGIQGVVTRRQGKARLAVNITALGTSVEVELDAESAELADGPAAGGQTSV
jgi:transcription antitermination factor NusG